MKIVYLTHSFKPYIGGVQQVVEYMAKEMTRRGHDVEVYTLVPPFSSLPRVEKLDGYVLRRFLGLSPSNAYYMPTPGFYDGLVKLQADVVHVHVVHSLVPLVAAMARKCNPQWRSLILTPHIHDKGFNWHTDIAWIFYRPILRRILRSFDLIHSISPHEASLLRRRFGVNPIIIPHGVSKDIQRYQWKSPEDFTVIYSGQLMSYKRVSLLVEAMSLLYEVVQDAKLVIIGKGPEKDKLMNLAGKLNVNVKFLDPLPRKEYLKRLANSSALCYLSESEAFCLTVLEALAVGLPVVAVEPWGENFKHYSRATVLPPSPTPEEVCKALVFVKNRTFPRRDGGDVPTWSNVSEMLEKLYFTGLAHAKHSG